MRGSPACRAEPAGQLGAEAAELLPRRETGVGVPPLYLPSKRTGRAVFLSGYLPAQYTFFFKCLKTFLDSVNLRHLLFSRHLVWLRDDVFHANVLLRYTQVPN